MGKSQQAKGRRAERELAHTLQAHGYDVEPGWALSYGEVPDLFGLLGVHIECKRCEQLRLGEWMAQADAAEGSAFKQGFGLGLGYGRFEAAENVHKE